MKAQEGRSTLDTLWETGSICFAAGIDSAGEHRLITFELGCFQDPHIPGNDVANMEGHNVTGDQIVNVQSPIDPITLND